MLLAELAAIFAILLVGFIIGYYFTISITESEKRTSEKNAYNWDYRIGYKNGRNEERELVVFELKMLHAESEKCPKFEKAFRQVALEEAINIVKGGEEWEATTI